MRSRISNGPVTSTWFDPSNRNRHEDDCAGIFSHRVGGSISRSARDQVKSRQCCVDGKEVSRDGRAGAVRRRRAKPHWPVPSAALQRLHDGILISSPNVFRKAVDAGKHPASDSDELPLLLTHGHRLMLNASELAEGGVSPQIEAGVSKPSSTT